MRRRIPDYRRNPRGIPQVMAIVPEDYIYFDCPLCFVTNDGIANSIPGIVECQGCGRRIEVMGVNW